MIILVDQDGVLADFTSAFYEAVQGHPHLVGHYDPATHSTFDIEDAFPPELKKEATELYHQEGFFRNLPPMPGAIEALNELESLGHSLFICTTPLKRYQFCAEEKYAWVEQHLGEHWLRRVIQTPDKTVIQGDLLIDDKPEIRGVGMPTWEHIVYDAPYNRLFFDNRRRMTWANWREVLFVR